MNGYFGLKYISLADQRAYGLDSQNVTTEQVPLVVSPAEHIRLRRVQKDQLIEESTGLPPAI